MNQPPLDIIVGKKYVCLNKCLQGLITIPLHSTIIPFDYDPKINSVRFNVIESNSKVYDAMTNVQNFLHMFKPESQVKAWKEASIKANALIGE